MILVGVKKGDTTQHATALAQKCAYLRIFEDASGKFNHSLLDVKGSALVVSQFTLCADTSRGRRPSFTEAESPEQAQQLYLHFASTLEELGVPTHRGVFGEHMVVYLENNGPVTIIMEE
jgi:D-tyrosyl-tRNA(Tyr) deacylase